MMKKSQHNVNNLTGDKTSCNEIDENAIQSFIRKANETDRLSWNIDRSDIQTLFERLHLSKNGLLTQAALLLFSKKPDCYFPFAACKIERYQDNSRTNLQSEEIIDGSLFQMPDRIMKTLVTKYLQPHYIYDGLIPVWEYPVNALYEAIVNAIIHRDYSHNTFFTITIFDDSLELWNAVDQIESLDMETLKKQHVSHVRNKLFADIFYRSGQAGLWGRGTLKMLEDAEIGEYPEPEFERFENGILVRFGKKVFEEEQQIPDVSNIKHAENILKLIKENPTVTIKEMAQELSMSDRNMKRILSELVNAKIIERIGSRKTGNWIIINDVIKTSL
jgi:ATP-dependent DNA helicase RecG